MDRLHGCPGDGPTRCADRRGDGVHIDPAAVARRAASAACAGLLVSAAHWAVPAACAALRAAMGADRAAGVDRPRAAP